MTALDPEGALVVAVFLGAVVQGFSGFAFSAVAVAILLQVQTPGLAIPLMMLCSLLIQSFSLARLRASISVRGCLPYLAGGVLLAGIVFDRIDPAIFRRFFGAVLMKAPAVPVDLLQHLPLVLLALFAGSGLGLFLFGKVSDVGFRRATAGVLFVSGLALMG